MYSSYTGHLEVAALLLAAGAKLSTKNKSGWRPVNLAACHEEPDVMSLLLDSGADIEARTEARGCGRAGAP